MHSLLEDTSHRPWPLPQGRPTWRQRWNHLLFAHWPVSVAQLRKHVPESLTIQEFDGSAWIGVVPFRISDLMLRPLPNMPGLSNFPELNLRTYVEKDGKPGVWFLTLEAGNPIAVWAAKRFFHLPYHWAKIQFQQQKQNFEFHSQRRRSETQVTFQSQYRPIGDTFTAQPDSIDHFLVERYCLYSQSRKGTLFRCEVHHAPWPLQLAEAAIDAQSFTSAYDMPQTEPPKYLHYSSGVDVLVWPLERIEETKQ